MKNSKSFRAAFILTLVSFLLTSAAFAQSADTDLQKRLSLIEQKAEKRRQELGIPGMSLVIVKDGKVVYAKGLGYKDFEKRIPVTPDTQFAIGSATKAFTALSVLMLQDDGKLSIDDHPQKYLSYFKINDPKTDAAIQVRDLLCHSSGLSRTDLAMITGKLNREELIKVAGIAKPTAGLREKFQYQNIMFAAAGEIVAKMSGEPWEEFVPERILKPLGMDNTTMSVAGMKKSKDYSYGYSYNFDTKETRRLPTRTLDAIAPAGSINSSANDMAKWLEFILGGGLAGNKRLVSEASFDEWTKPQMKISPDGKVSYGFGWFVQDWNGRKLIQHGGNIDGFNSMVALLPDENVGFVLLTNVSASSLGGELIQTVFSGLLDKLPGESAPLSEEAKGEAGTYKFPQAGFDIVVAVEDGKLVMKVPNQPTYELKNVEGRKYRLGGAPDGFFITFKDAEALLEQPQGNFTLKKAGAAPAAEEGSADEGDARGLIGKYSSEQAGGPEIEIREVEGKVSLVVGGQPPYPLEMKEKDLFRSPGLPESYAVRSVKDAQGKVTSIVLVQPNGDFSFKRTASDGESAEPLPDAAEINAKMIEALGGETNLRKITSREIKLEMNFINQGVTAKGTAYAKAPDEVASSIELFALGKNIGWIRERFDGSSGGESYSFGPEEVYTGQRLEDVKFGADFYGYLDAASKTKSAVVDKIEKVGDEDAYRIRIEPLKASPITLWVSAKTFLPLKRRFLVVSSTTAQKIPVTETYSDYRNVDGVMIPFRSVNSNPNMGDLVTVVKEIKQNVKIPDSVFGKK